MARLRNRLLKADFYSDPELLRWPRDKRETYRGLWAIAEDSGCLEDDPFGWKLLLWPSPLDADITVELLAQWRDELVEAGKLVPYEAEGKRYLWLRTFHQHEQPTNPQRPDLPLPPWVTCEAVEHHRRSGRVTRCRYHVDDSAIPQMRKHTMEPSRSRDGAATESLPPYRTVPYRTVPYRIETLSSAEADASEPAAKLEIVPLKESEESDSLAKAEPRVEVLLAMYHELCPSLPRVRSVTDVRVRRLKRAVKELGIDGLRALFVRAEASDFLSGRSGRWRADIDWLLKPEHIPRVLEGCYDNRQAPGKAASNVARAMAIVAQCEAEEVRGVAG